MKIYAFFLVFLPISVIAQNNVGIGVLTPVAKLDIRGVGDSPAIPGTTSTGLIRLGISANDGIDIGKLDGFPFSGWIQAGYNGTTTDPFSLQPLGGGVGIGVLDPNATLHISTNSTTTFPQLRLTEEEDDFARIKFESTVNPLAFWDIAGKADTITNSSKLNFYFANSLNNGDRMTITGIGDVGIGNSSPEAKLDILGGDWNLDAGNPGDLRIGSSSANAFRIGVATGGGGAGTARLYAQGGSMFLGTNNTAHVTISTAGNIGIGETNPNNKVRVLGHASSAGHVLSVSTAYSGNSNIRAIEGFSTPATGYGFGGYFYGGARGVQAIAQGGSSSGTSIGVEASAYGSTGTRTGLFARASGGSTNWAGYFSEGNVYVTNELRIGSGAINGATGYKVAIDGKVIAEELRVQLSGAWPDYVFSEDYALPPLSEVASFINEENHLPGVPSASEVELNGLHLGEMQRRMVEKIEELMLYILQQEARIEKLEQALQKK